MPTEVRQTPFRERTAADDLFRRHAGLDENTISHHFPHLKLDPDKLG